MYLHLVDFFMVNVGTVNIPYTWIVWVWKGLPEPQPICKSPRLPHSGGHGRWLVPRDRPRDQQGPGERGRVGAPKGDG